MQLEGELAKALEESHRGKEIVSAMARELVQPLTTIRLQTHVLRREACECCGKRLETVERNVERFCATIEEIFARLWNDAKRDAPARLARTPPPGAKAPEDPFFP